MSYQQSKLGQSTIVNQTTVPVMPMPNTTVVLPAGSGTINDLRLLAAGGTTAQSGLKMYRPLAPKPAPTSSTTTIQNLMATSTMITTVPTLVTPSVTISPTISITPDHTHSTAVGTQHGSVPIGGSLVVQPVVTPLLQQNQQQHQPHTHQQHSTLYTAGSKLVLPVGTTIKVTQNTIDQHQQQPSLLQPIPVAIASQPLNSVVHAAASAAATAPVATTMQPTLSSVSVTQQPAQQQPTKMLLNARPIASAVRTVVSGNVPPLYMPPGKAALGVGATSVLKQQPTVAAAIAAVTNSKVELDPSRMRLADSSVIHRMPIGLLKPAPGNAVEQQQEPLKPMKSNFPVPVLSPFTVPKIVQPQQVPQQAVAPPDACKARLVMFPNNPSIAVEPTGNRLNTTVSLQMRNEPPNAAAVVVVEDELSNDDDDELVMDLDESNAHEIEDKEKSAQESVVGNTDPVAEEAKSDTQQENNIQKMAETESPVESSTSIETIELSEKKAPNQLNVLSTPEKVSPDRSILLKAAVSPRLQKRSSSEHQQPAKKDPTYTQKPASSSRMINRRRFSEIVTVRQPPAGVRIPFTHENYYIPLQPMTSMGASSTVAAKFAGPNTMKSLPAPPPPPPPPPPLAPQNVLLMCNEKLDLPKQHEDVRRNRSSSVQKHAKPLTASELLSATDLVGSEMDQELAGLEQAMRKRHRQAEENNTERGSIIHSRSTSTSSDSNLTVGRVAGRGNSQPSEPSKKTNAKSRSAGAGAKNRTQITPSESSLSLQDEGGAMHDPSTVADHLRWYDGIGYLSESSLHFEFNKFGMVQPLSVQEYDRHCATNVYKDLQQPIEKRQPPLLAKNSNRSRTNSEARVEMYRCEVCQGCGRAADFVTPEICSMKCLNDANHKAVQKYIMNSTHALQQGGSSMMETKIKVTEQADKLPSLVGLVGTEAKSSKALEASKGVANKKKQPVKKNAKTTRPSSLTTTSSSTSDEDSVSSLSLNSSTFLKRQTFRDFLPTSLDDENEEPAQPSSPSASPPNDGSDETEFNWQRYLKEMKAEPAPVHLFGPKAFPSSQNRFRIGMKLEAIDPENCSLFCVCTVAEVRGYRMKLHFDGYPPEYDFWVNADSNDIFPPGWCQQTNRALQPPAAFIGKPFHWKQYLEETNAPIPEKEWFAHLNHTSDRNKFEVGMSIEADDLKKSGKVCVASVADKLGHRILVHFDGWDNRYDYWVSIYSSYIHPVNWHVNNKVKITAPPDWNRPFDWAKYIKSRIRNNSSAVGAAEKNLFKTRPPVAFKLGHRLEVVDRKQKKLIRPATVVGVDGYELQLCFDGWPRSYSFWIEDDSPELHPINWCQRTNHPMEPPPNYGLMNGSFEGTCEFKICLSRGNAKFPNKKFHDRSAECPYKRSNWMSEDRKPLRISHEYVERASIDDQALQVQSFVKEEQEDELMDSKNVTSNMNNNTHQEDIAVSLKSEITSGSLKTVTKPSTGQRRGSVFASVAVPSKRTKRETNDLPPSGSSTATSTSTPTPPPSRDPSKERIVRLRELEDISASNPPANSSTTTTSAQGRTNLNASVQLALPVIEDYGPQLLHSYEKWLQHSRYLDECTEQSGVMRKNPLNWTTDEMARYIEQLPGCEEYAKKIRQEEITGRSFLSFTQADLIDYLGVKMGPAIKIYNRIIRLRQLVTTKFIQL
uniref:SAM domain-containing protein n=1 Tax=Anopheles epiroticus TaxID=199890 RepID=A0A182PIV4_9DIPT